MNFEMRFLGYFIMSILSAMSLGISLTIGTFISSSIAGIFMCLFGVRCIITVSDEVFDEQL